MDNRCQALTQRDNGMRLIKRRVTDAQFLRVKYNEILRINCNEKAGFAGKCNFTPPSEDSHD
jgi:hypothetical protein